MIHVLPVSDIANSLLGQSRIFAMEHGLDASGLTFEKCHEVVVAFTASVLSDTLLWLPYERQQENSKGLLELLERSTSAPVYAKDYTPQKTVLGDFVQKLLNPEVEVARATARLFPWYNPIKEDASENEAMRLTDLYDEEVIADVWDALGKVLDGYIPEGGTWDIWYMRNLGRDVYLHKGSDWRIEDWKRLRGLNGVQDG